MPGYGKAGPSTVSPISTPRCMIPRSRPRCGLSTIAATGCTRAIAAIAGWATRSTSRCSIRSERLELRLGGGLPGDRLSHTGSTGAPEKGLQQRCVRRFAAASPSDRPNQWPDHPRTNVRCPVKRSRGGVAMLHRLQPEAPFRRSPVQSSALDATLEARKREGVSVRHLRAIGGLVILLAGGDAALAQTVPDLKGTWIPAKGAHLVEGPTRHQASGTVPVPGDDTLRTHTSKFVFRFDRQEGPTIWRVLSSAKMYEKSIAAISVDGKRFVPTDEDGR